MVFIQEITWIPSYSPNDPAATCEVKSESLLKRQIDIGEFDLLDWDFYGS